MDDLKDEIKLLRQEVSELKQMIMELTSTCDRMDEHITFVNGVYTTVRSPLDFMTNRIRRIMGVSSHPELPVIQSSSFSSKSDEELSSE